jgi:hypothetical protein
MALTFGKRDFQKYPEVNLQRAQQVAKRYLSIIFGAVGSGLDYDRIVISIHRNYSDYSRFLQEMRSEWASIIDIQRPFMISLTSKEVIQPLSLKHFADHLKSEKES